MRNRFPAKDNPKDLPSVPGSLHPHRAPRLGKVGEVPANENKNRGNR